jgi:hypothetical protein
MTHRSASPPSDEPEPAAERLDRFVRANACIVYHQNLPDPEFAAVKCSIYGVPKTNELFVRISNGKVSFVAVALSPLEFPVMADRIFGLDVADHAVAFGLADQLWEQHQAELLAASPAL